MSKFNSSETCSKRDAAVSGLRRRSFGAPPIELYVRVLELPTEDLRIIKLEIAGKLVVHLPDVISRREFRGDMKTLESVDP